MKKITKTFKEIEVSNINIKWSIHACSKFIKNGQSESVETKYMTIRKIGRRKETLLHDTFAKAMVEIGL